MPSRTPPPPTRAPLQIRTAEDHDSPGIIALVGACFAEYPGCVLDVNREEAGLLTPTTAFVRFWVLTDNVRIRGSIACTEHAVDGEPGVELKKCYVHRSVRGQGWASRLVALVEDFARDHDRAVIELWSDTRFVTAHAVYAHLGYRRTGEQRALHDLSATEEYRFVKRVDA